MIDVSRALKHSGGIVAFDVVLPPPEIDGMEFTEVKVRGETIGLDADTLSVVGEIFTVATQPCARCGKPADFTVDCAFEEILTRSPSAEKPDSFPIEGNNFDPSELAESLIVLALPIRVLCKEDCMGLCPICGKDLNEGLCRHE